MQVADVMSCLVATCRPADTLNRAVELMWNEDCGCVVVVDDADRPVGMLTDRDACIASWTQGRPAHEIPVGSAMAGAVATCSPDDSLGRVHEMLRQHQLRRLPIVDASGTLVGIITLADLVQAAEGLAPAKRVAAWQELHSTWSAVTRPRKHSEVAVTLPAAEPASAAKKSQRAKPKANSTPRKKPTAPVTKNAKKKAAKKKTKRARR